MTHDFNNSMLGKYGKSLRFKTSINSLRSAHTDFFFFLFKGNFVLCISYFLIYHQIFLVQW